MRTKAQDIVIEVNFGELMPKQDVKQEVKPAQHEVTVVTHEEDVLTDPSNVAQREKYIEKVEVLSKVRGLLLLPNMEMATTKQVAAFYEVGAEAIRSIIKRHRSELESDGVVHKKYSEIKEVTVQDELLLSSGVSYRGTYIFPKRAILRVGMLLRDSDIAKEIRTQLLNIEEHATNEQRTQEIDKDGLLLLDIIRAKDPIKQAQAIAAYTEYKDARAKEAEEKAAKYEEKASKFDLVTGQAGLLTMTSVGKSYVDGVSANALNKFLIQQGVLYKNKVDGIHMYKKGHEQYFKVVTYEAGYRTLKVTLEGALFIADLYKSRNNKKSA
ncbi:phage antirepressor KilAC domain-containing protein [Bacillus cereus group sp. BY17LC]|uniref:phage antirepressor KilAC domain-containing protein n=1 Tax=Bacillus cereus group sp. BY17LC TaxID=3018082 RepID=UPI0022DEA615|nr:phage antirepressor KilAC domain-containing protein [Bacillus cereus group sp. BY17LC]MDA1836488.1 phage antirepressor KilAC domain-containing protein [Bacillus cereus group sp. BY17LC]